MANQLVINPFTEEMLSSMQCMLNGVLHKLADTIDLASEAETKEVKKAHASSPLRWRAQISDQIWELQDLHDVWSTTDHYLENEIPDASMLFEVFKKFCEQISSSIDAKVKEYYEEENLA